MSGGISASTVAMGMMAASAAMTVVGSIQQSNAQRQAGDAAVANAQMKQQQLEAQAKEQEGEALQQRAKANNDAASGQRNEIEAVRKGQLLAGRAQAVMGASGAGVDPSMTAGLLAEGKYAGDVADYEGADRARVDRNAANVNDYNAASLRTGGINGVISANRTKDSYDSMATGTLVGGLAKAGMSIASKYGGDFGGTPNSLTPSGSQAISQAAVDKYGTVIYDPDTLT